MALPTVNTPGYGPFRGRVACDCLRAWLPVFEAELNRVGVIKHSIDVAQLTGGASQSGGTHSRGGAADVWQHDDRTIKIAREMGAAAWARTRAQGFDPHCHLVLNGCPHNGPARYQIADLAGGMNGLAGRARARDDGPTPRRLRTWTAGIKWAKARQKPARVKYKVYVAKEPGDFKSRPVNVFAGPGHHYDVIKTVGHGATFTANGKTHKTKSGSIWRQGVKGGWLPDRRLRKA